jgi:hypothetical protein
MIQIEMSREEADEFQTALDEVCGMTMDFADRMHPEDEALSAKLANLAGALRQLQFKIVNATG